MTQQVQIRRKHAKAEQGAAPRNRWLLAGCIGALCLAPMMFGQAQNTPIESMGKGYWERSNGGDFALKPGASLKVVTVSNVVVRGDDVDRVHFEFHQKVRARSKEDAAVLMGALGVSAQTLAEGTILTVAPASALTVHTELEVTVPKKLGQLIIENQFGSIEVLDVDSSVVADTVRGPIHMDRIQGSVVSRTGRGEIRLGVITGTVRCSSGGGPIFLERSGGEADCLTAGGNVVVGRVGGPLSVSTESGGIQVDSVNGPVRAHTMSGPVEIAQARGLVFADTQGGSIHVGQSEGVKAESAGGMIRLRNASGALSVATMMGDILAQLMGPPASDSSLMTGSGDITLTIPSDMGLSIRALTGSGVKSRIVSDFPEIQVKSIGFLSPVTGQGSINGGGPLLHLDASGGRIFLKKGPKEVK